MRRADSSSCGCYCTGSNGHACFRRASGKNDTEFCPNLVAMIGIAAGVKGNEQGLGDILAPAATFDLGAGKVSGLGRKLQFSPDPNPIAINVRLRERLRHWVNRNGELERICSVWTATLR